MMKYKYHPNTKEELIEAIKKEIFEVQGTNKNPNWEADLNCIDTSKITDMSFLFSSAYGLENFNGDISGWDVINVKDIRWMFNSAEFNGDIGDWNISDEMKEKTKLNNISKKVLSKYANVSFKQKELNKILAKNSNLLNESYEERVIEIYKGYNNKEDKEKILAATVIIPYVKENKMQLKKKFGKRYNDDIQILS